MAMIENHYEIDETEQKTGEKESSKWRIIDRVRGVLTSDDRKFYFNDDGEAQSSRDTRYRIRKRVTSSLLDFPILSRYLGSDDKKKVLENIEGTATEVLISGFQLFYELSIELQSQRGHDDGIVEEILEEAITRSHTDSSTIPEPSVSIELEETEPDLDEIKEKLEIDQATPKEYLYYANHGDLEEILIQRAEQGRSIFLRTPSWSEQRIIELDPEMQLQKYNRSN
jgi:hypothetical protein